MHSCKGLELHSEAVKVTWCGCELCSAMGPRFMTLVKNGHEYTVEFSSQCCYDGIDEREGVGKRHPGERPVLKSPIPG